MPYPGPRVILQMIDFDEGDDQTSGTAWEQLDAMNSRFLGFEFSDHADEIDELKVEFRNDDYSMTDQPTFMVGQKFLVTWGWPDAMAPPRRMIVAKRQNGNPYTVWMRDPTVLLHQKKQARHMDNVTDAEFVRRVAKEHGYVGTLAHIDETKTRHSVTQPKTRTDAQQMRHLARRNGFEFFIDGKGLHWRARSLQSDPVRTFHYRTDPGIGTIIGEPTIDQKTDKTPSKVIVEGRDPQTKQKVTAEVSPSTSTEPSLGHEIELGDPDADDRSKGKRGRRAEIVKVYPAGYITLDEARTMAEAIYRESTQGAYTMKMKVVGDAKLEAKWLIAMNGLCDALDGVYYLREVIHSIGPGSYTCELQAQRDAMREIKTSRKIRQNNVSKAQKTAESEADETPAEMKRHIEVRLGPDGEPIPTWVYDDPTYPIESDLTQEEIAALSERALLSLAEAGARSQLPDN